MGPFLLAVAFALAFNAQVCAKNPADTDSVLKAMKPGVCKIRKEVYIVNK